METATISTATNVNCPVCYRKICKIREYPQGVYVELKHKGAFVLAEAAIIKCIGCDRWYKIDSEGNIEEVEIG